MTNNPEHKKEQTILEPIGKDEMNLVEFPITLLSKRHISKQKTIEFCDTVLGENNTPTKREWIVTGSDKFGLPLVYDNDVLLALFQIAKEKNFNSPTIYFSRYQLLKIMGWKDEGNNYKRIEEALDRLRGVSIKAKNAFWDNEKKGYFTVNFGIIDSYSLFDAPARTNLDQTTLSFNNVVLNSVLYKSIQSGYIKNVSLKLYFGLKGVISKRLYRYLDKKRYGKKKFEINLFTLARTHIGLAKSQYSSQIKEKLDPAHDELIQFGFLKSAEYMPTADRLSEKVVYTFGKKIAKDNDNFAEVKVPVSERSDNKEPAKDFQSEILELLLDSGVTESIARQLVTNYPLRKIELQINAIPFRGAKNPAGMLVAAIQGDWALPAEFAKQIKHDQKLKQKKQQQLLEERQKAERRQQIEAFIASLSDEETEALNQEVRSMVKQECKFIKGEIPDYIFRPYIFKVVAERLGLSSDS